MFKQLLLLSLVGVALAAPNLPSSKIEPRLTNTLRTKNPVNVFVKFDNGNRDVLDNLRKEQYSTRGDKITHLVSELKSFSQSSQMNALSLFQSPQFAYSAVNFKQFWVSNELFVKGATPQIIHELEALPEVIEIREERIVQIDDASSTVVKLNQTNQWNLEKVEAPNAWGLPGGNNGQGVVVANIDTGVRYTHEALRRNYRADYGWFDPFEGGEYPIDSDGHGSHTMGTIAGAGGIGIAPGAQWIACQGCVFIFCSEYALKACGEWMLCPTRSNGTEEDCSKAPNVISNSWGHSAIDDPFYNEIIEAWKAADIIPVFAIGNGGPDCSTTRSPGDQSVISVGSTTEEDALSDFSSVGPAANDRMKPDIVAPGSEIYSALDEEDDTYGVSSGTSMATPHVAGAVALLLSRNPNLNYEQVKDILQKNTDTGGLVDLGVVCGGLNSTTFPNNHYGHGRLNVRKALEAVINNS